MSPYLPFIVLSERVTVYSKSFSISAEIPNTLFVIFKSPTIGIGGSVGIKFLTFINSTEIILLASIFPWELIEVTWYSSLSLSEIVYVIFAGKPIASIFSLCFRVKVETPFLNSIFPYLPFIVLSERVTVYVKSFVVSAALPNTLIVSFKSPTTSVGGGVGIEFLTFINSTEITLLASILPFELLEVTSYPSLSLSTIVYSIFVGNPIASMLSLSFRVKVETPFINTISPYVPFIVLSERVSVYVKSFVISAVFPETLFVTFKSPTTGFGFLIFVNSTEITLLASILPFELIEVTWYS